MNRFTHDACVRALVCVLVLLTCGAAFARPARPAPPLTPPTGTIVNVSTEPQLQAAMQGLTSNMTIVLAPGTYVLTRTLYIHGAFANVGIRGATADSDDVVLIGPGMNQASYGDAPFGVWTGDGVNGVTIANLTIRDFYYHPIIFNGGTQNPRVYNVHLIDAGQQFIKVNPDASNVGASNGILEYSVIEFTTTARDDYPKGIDIQFATNWIVRHNLFRNLVAPAGQIMGAGILVWRGSSNTLVEGNSFVNCHRGIMFGADDTISPSHSGGIIRNNFFFRSPQQPGDVGIILSDSPSTQVLNNTIVVSGTYGTPIELRYPGTTGGLVANNLLDGVIGPRDGGTATLSHNYVGAPSTMFVDAASGDLHLSASATGAIDQGDTLANVADDWDGDPRPSGSAYDIGADERAGATTPPPSTGGATASFVKLDTATAGSWRGAYGGDGYAIANVGQSAPSYVQLSAGGTETWTWANSTTDARAPLRPSAADRIASCWYNGASFTFDLNLTDGQPHQVALYAVDWDSFARAERVEILDAATSAVLDSRAFSGFHGGQYLVWMLSGHVKLRVTTTGGVNSVVSGLFFDRVGAPAPSGPTATFVKSDATTQGSWRGVYGADGYSLANVGASAPAYAQVTVGGSLTWTWNGSTADVRALQRPAASDRVAACWYSGGSFSFDINLTDGATHQIAVYGLDWDSPSRAERIDVLDASTGAVLDSRALAGFHDGQYVVWRVSGHVTVKVTLTGGINAVVSGLFFDR